MIGADAASSGSNPGQGQGASSSGADALSASNSSTGGESAAAAAARPQMGTMGRKHDHVVWLRLKPLQQHIYEAFLNSAAVKEALNSSKSPLAALTVLKKVGLSARALEGGGVAGGWQPGLVVGRLLLEGAVHGMALNGLSAASMLACMCWHSNVWSLSLPPLPGLRSPRPAERAGSTLGGLRWVGPASPGDAAWGQLPSWLGMPGSRTCPAILAPQQLISLFH